MSEETAKVPRATACHEAGHTIVALSLGGSVTYVSAVERLIKATIPKSSPEKAAYLVAGEVGEESCAGADPMETVYHTAADVSGVEQLAVEAGAQSPADKDEFLNTARDLARQYIDSGRPYFDEIVRELMDKGELTEEDVKRIEQMDL